MSDRDALFDEHGRGVFRYLCRVVGRPDTARDLTQEVFLRVARSRLPDGDGHVRQAWIFKIARNLALNHVRDARRRPESVPLVDVSRPPSQELAAALREALAALPAMDREVFLLRELAGLEYEEIAETCETTVDAARSRVHRARRRLREVLGGSLAVERKQGVRVVLHDRTDDRWRRK